MSKITRTGLALSVAFRAGNYLFESLNKEIHSIREKGNLDFVSSADIKSNEIIVSAITKLFPKDSILSEELSEATGNSGYKWIVDPLDGTHNFLAGLMEYGVLIALERNKEIICGVCYFPAFKEVFFAEKGRGAFLNHEKIHVSKLKKIRGQMFCADAVFRHREKMVMKEIKKFCGAGMRLRAYGSSAFSMTRVAKGQALVANNVLVKPWDVAAPCFIVEQAGGKVTDGNGNRWGIYSNYIVATNGIVHDQILKLRK